MKTNILMRLWQSLVPCLLSFSLRSVNVLPFNFPSLLLGLFFLCISLFRLSFLQPRPSLSPTSFICFYSIPIFNYIAVIFACARLRNVPFLLILSVFPSFKRCILSAMTNETKKSCTMCIFKGFVILIFQTKQK